MSPPSHPKPEIHMMVGTGVSCLLVHCGPQVVFVIAQADPGLVESPSDRTLPPRQDRGLCHLFRLPKAQCCFSGPGETKETPVPDLKVGNEGETGEDASRALSSSSNTLNSAKQFLAMESPCLGFYQRVPDKRLRKTSCELRKGILVPVILSA